MFEPLKGMTTKPRSTSFPLHRSALVAVVFAAACLNLSAAAQPDLVPRGWKREAASSNKNAIRFTSPDGYGTLIMRDLGAAAASPETAIGPRPGERVTYRRRGQSWWVLSGYRGDEIVYRRAGYACGHHRVHVIELIYPRDQKRQYDPVVTSISRRLDNYRSICPKR